MWVATAFGALDLTGMDLEIDERLVVLPRNATMPLFLKTEGEALWRRLVEDPVEAQVLSTSEQALLHEFEEFGLASDDVDHPNRITHIESPWLSSFAHELVYALAARVAQDRGIDTVAIKGPALHHQGLRTYEHSGDVDMLVEPGRVDDLVEALRPWGWTPLPTVWSGTRVKHGVTLLRGEWGCEIDLHWRMPGWAVSDEEGFAEVHSRAVPMEYAGTEVLVPDRATHAVLSALHLARPQFAGEDDRPNARALAVLELGGAASRAVARRLKAEASLLPELRAVFPGETIEPDYDPPRDWNWRVHTGAIGGNLAALRTLPLGQRAQVIFRFLWPSPLMLEDWLTRYSIPRRGPLRNRYAWIRRLMSRARDK